MPAARRGRLAERLRAVGGRDPPRRARHLARGRADAARAPPRALPLPVRQYSGAGLARRCARSSGSGCCCATCSPPACAPSARAPRRRGRPTCSRPDRRREDRREARADPGRRLGHAAVAVLDGRAAQAAGAAAAGPLAARGRRRARGRRWSRVERVWLGCGGALRDAVSAVAGLRADRLVVEPSGRDTLAAVALGCAVIAELDPDAVVAVVTADHVIEPVERFAATLTRPTPWPRAATTALVTFGVVPDLAGHRLRLPRARRAAGRGRRAVVRVPGEARPAGGRGVPGRRAGAYLWNSGMFVWRAATLLRAVDAFVPSPRRCCASWGAAYGTPAWDGARARRLADPAERSVDYGVMEPASASPDFTVVALPLDVALARRRLVAGVRRGARGRRRRQRGRRRARGAARQPRQRRRVLRPRPPRGAGRLRGAGRGAHARPPRW